ncbi:MAG: C45 family autoproteolytic acyltransferase/hydrolase [Proteobacteria bacterium]|nr:C45 family autoproteolytic acyltransferase/hydrolase [Pseudomonadota bacterium]
MSAIYRSYLVIFLVTASFIGCSGGSPVTIQKMDNTYFLVSVNMSSFISHKAMGQIYAQQILQILPDYEAIVDLSLKDEFDLLESRGLSFSTAIARAITLKATLPQDYQDEIDGMLSVFSYDQDVLGDGHLSKNEFLIYQLFPDVGRPTQCSASAAYGDSSATGKTIIGRNFDWYQLPNNGMSKLHAVTIIKNGSKSVVFIHFLGQLIPVSAFNSAGVFAALLDVGTGADYPSLEGKQSYPFGLRYALENYSTLQDVANYIKGQNYAYNHLVFLADQTTAGVVEENIGSPARGFRTATSTLISDYTWNIPDVFATVNTFMLPGNYAPSPPLDKNVKRWNNFTTLYNTYLEQGKIDIPTMKLIAGNPGTDGGAATSGAIYRSTDLSPTLQSIIMRMDTYEMWVAFSPLGSPPTTPTYIKVFSEKPF